MKVVCISDTHRKHDQVIIPECDLLLHAGDFSSMGTISETKAFLKWFSSQPAKHKVFISGNHDFLDQENPTLFKELLKEYPGVIYLRDEGCVIEGVRVWGRPWTPTFYDWAFMADRGSPKMRSTLGVIPSGTDILLTHGPAYGILDMTSRGERVGCEDLLNELPRIQPKYLVFGHIHESCGIQEHEGIQHINAAVLNDRYRFKNQPIVFDIP